MSILETAIETLRKYPLCDRCLGRLFAQLGRGLTNKDRGKALKISILMELHRRAMEGDRNALNVLQEIAKSYGLEFTSFFKSLGIDLEKVRAPCYICGDKIDELIDRYSKRIIETLQREGFKSFLVGILPPKEFNEREREVARALGLKYWESIKSELKREIGKRVRDATGIAPDFEEPEVTIVVDIDKDSIHLEIPSLLFLGRYWKLGRRISQVPWIKSDGTKKYPLSIEEVLQQAVPLANAERAIFHGAGREDVDVRMLGSGRPFVLELYRPRNRNVDPRAIEEAVNKFSPWIKISLEMKVRREIVSKIKESGSRSFKIYRALIVTRDPVSEDDLKRLEEFFRNRVIQQWTPLRVIRRRKNILRRRKVIEVRTLKLTDNVFEALIKCEGGLYIKELVSGDLGRTTPSFSEFLKTDAVCVELDVVYVQKYI